MADTSLIIGNGNWAVKETSLLGYNIIQSKYVPIEMTVSRNTTATRVNEQGFIELVPRNLLTYSNDLTNGIWTKTNTTIALNTIANPLNGLVNGQTFTPNTTNGDHFVFGSGTTIAGQSYVISFFVKENGYTNCRVGNAATGAGVWFNLSNGTIISGTGGTITALSNGWYLASYLLTASGTSVNPLISFAPSTSTNFAGNGISGGYVFGAQLEQGPTATEYFPTTNRFNIPRVDYSTGTASLLVEPARTNNILQSQDLSNASWTKTNVTITANSITSPIASFNSDSIVENSASNVVFGVNAASRPSGLTLGTTCSVSFFAKKITRDFCYFNDFNGFQIPNVRVYFNLSTGLVGTFTSGVLNPKMENYGNGWYRCSFQFVVTINTSIDYRIASTTSDNTLSYSGTIGQESISVTACQFEAGSTATSYIPTTTLIAGVTRAADVISKTGISSLIGQTEGTIFVEANLTANTDDRRIIVVSNGTEAQRIMFWTLGTTLYANFNTILVTIGTFPILPISTAKMALAYTIAGGSTTYSIKLNNNTLITGTAAAAPTPLSAIHLGTNTNSVLQLNDRIKSVQLYKTALSPGQLATLTAII